MKNALVNLLWSVGSLLRDGSDTCTYSFAPKKATGLSGAASKAVVSCMTSYYVKLSSVSNSANPLTTFVFPMLEVASSKMPSGMTQS
jgi:hypothetical protein